MSSEEAAKQAVIDSVAQFALTIAREGEAEWHPDSLDAYKTAIERRVLAQQPCRMCHELPCDGVVSVIFRCCNQKEPRDRCDPCQARAAQTQETSG